MLALENITGFQHTAARRRLQELADWYNKDLSVSTHSRPKAAALVGLQVLNRLLKFQHTAARRRLRNQCGLDIIGMWVSTHSRPKAAAEKVFASNAKQGVSTHSRPKAAAFR